MARSVAAAKFFFRCVEQSLSCGAPKLPVARQLASRARSFTLAASIHQPQQVAALILFRSSLCSHSDLNLGYQWRELRSEWPSVSFVKSEKEEEDNDDDDDDK